MDTQTQGPKEIQDSKLNEILGLAREAAYRGDVPGARDCLREAKKYADKTGLDIYIEIQKIEAELNE